MDVEIVIRYSDERACSITFTRPDTGEVLYQIVTPVAGIPESFGDGLRETRRLFDIEPWLNNKPH
jgi:hypothetical protein